VEAQEAQTQAEAETGGGTSVNETLDIGPRRCKDCRTVVPPPRMWRCGSCLLKRIEKIRRQGKSA